MSDFDLIRQSIEGRAADQFASLIPTVAVTYENVAFTPPVNKSWIRLTINSGTGKTMGMMGDGHHVGVRDTGLISVQLFVPQGSGLGLSRGYIDSLVEVFEHVHFSGIFTSTASINSVGENDGWHQTNVTFPFRRRRDV